MDIWYQFRRLAELEPVQIEGWVFRLHYWVTSTGIFIASAIAFAKQYFGDPIECIFVSITRFNASAQSFLEFFNSESISRQWRARWWLMGGMVQRLAGSAVCWW